MELMIFNKLLGQILKEDKIDMLATSATKIKKKESSYSKNKKPLAESIPSEQTENTSSGSMMFVQTEILMRITERYLEMVKSIGSKSQLWCEVANMAEEAVSILEQLEQKEYNDYTI